MQDEASYLCEAQKRGLTPYRKGKPALQPQRVRGLSPFLGKAACG